MQNINARLPLSLRARADRASKQQGITRSQLVRDAVEDYLINRNRLSREQDIAAYLAICADMDHADFDVM